jgi:UTP-glucose-1-phosphate uridylyltransferase
VIQAVIPAAAFSAASFPASHTTPPALFPVLDADGILKPALLVLVEQVREYTNRREEYRRRERRNSEAGSS